MWWQQTALSLWVKWFISKVDSTPGFAMKALFNNANKRSIQSHEPQCMTPPLLGDDADLARMTSSQTQKRCWLGKNDHSTYMHKSKEPSKSGYIGQGSGQVWPGIHIKLQWDLAKAYPEESGSDRSRPYMGSGDLSLSQVRPWVFQWQHILSVTTVCYGITHQSPPKLS